MKHPIVLASLAFILVLIALQPFQTELLFQRERINEGEYWRILTGSLVHTNYFHLLFNASGVFILALLFSQHLTIPNVLFSLFWLISCVGMGLYVFNAQLIWYAGLSGALYGCYLIASVRAFRQQDYWLGVPVFIIISGKLIWDQFDTHATQLSESLIQAPVMTDAHLYGAIGAIVFILLQRIFKKLLIKS